MTHLKPSSQAIKDYYAALKVYGDQNVRHEGAVRSAFQNLLSETSRGVHWHLIPDLTDTRKGIRPDGTFRDDYFIERGHWEAKDTDDDLGTEIKKKTAKGYPLKNIIFEDTRQAILFQNGQSVMSADLTQPKALIDPPERLLRLYRTRSGNIRKGHRRVQGSGAGLGPGSGRQDP